MKALFTKDCFDWVGHLIIQATIWKQRQNVDYYVKSFLCMCCKYCCMHVYFKAMSCFVPVKQKQNDQSMHYILLIWHLIILIVLEGTLVWLNLGQVSFPKVPVQKKRQKKGQSAIMWSGTGDASDFLHALSQRRTRQSASVLNDNHKDAEVNMGENKAGNKINNSDRHWACSRSIIQSSGGSSIAYHYDIKGSCRLESPGRHQRQVSPRHAW